jgi:hypothetical protein
LSSGRVDRDEPQGEEAPRSGSLITRCDFRAIGARLSDHGIASHTERIEIWLEMLLSDVVELSLSGCRFRGLWVKAQDVREIRWAQVIVVIKQQYDQG